MEDVLAIYKEATEAAKTAVEACGPEDTRGLNCGFGWVEIRPARGPFVSFCKRNGIGGKHWHSGWLIDNPGNFRGQQVDHQYAGAKAFAEVLQQHGIQAIACSRLD